MKANKNLLGTLFLTIGVFACTLGAHAANSANAFNDVFLCTKGAKSETTSQENLYKAYYCTTAQAGTFFGGADTYQAVTTFLTANMANYNSGMSALATGGVKLDFDLFDEDEYEFDKYPGTLAAGDYLAVIAYASADENIVRVFSATATGDEGDRSLRFEPGTTGGGEAGLWTTVNVPEPTSGALALFALAALALKRKRVVSC